ncbi:MAG: CpaF/VirB11 family protein, partial [Pseudomonadales bacterium]|nr:CpaF/VirB11 family protein [Pseudomonadales bacterium]
RAIREQIASAVNVLVQQNRLADGTRKVTHVMEVVGFDGEDIQLKSVFEYVKKGIDEEGKVVGYYAATGYVPQFYRDMIAQGQKLDTSIFEDQEVDIAGLDQSWN